MRWMRAVIFAPAALALGCSPQAATDTAGSPRVAEQEQARHPVSGLVIIDVKVGTGDARHVFRTELAASPEAQARGLMFRTELGDDEAMLFPSARPGLRSFYMKNTPIPLDIIFIGTDSRILNIAAMTEPYSLDSILSAGPAIAVLEIRGGLAQELGIAPGDAVEWNLPD